MPLSERAFRSRALQPEFRGKTRRIGFDFWVSGRGARGATRSSHAGPHCKHDAPGRVLHAEVTMTRLFATLVSALALLCPTLAHAASDFARPPDDYREPREEPPPRTDDEPPRGDYFEPEESALRLSTGPVLRALREHADGGFTAAVDIGAKAAGARFAGSWVRTGSDRGLSQYDGQLWLDFGAGERLHPILAAGAGLARLESADSQGAVHASTIGIGTLRGTLEYVLPIHEANARAGIDVEGALPAIRGADAPDVSGWVLITARVGIGF